MLPLLIWNTGSLAPNFTVVELMIINQPPSIADYMSRFRLKLKAIFCEMNY